MQTLAEIQRRPGLNLAGRAIHRSAVRAIIQRGSRLLMIHSAKAGDYKFPGGGVNEGESHAAALARELREEAGVSLKEVLGEFGAVIEYDRPVEPDFDLFRMISHYYRCEVQDGFGRQELEGYEAELGFEPVWIPIDAAIAQNRSLLNPAQMPFWLKREIFILETIRRGPG